MVFLKGSWNWDVSIDYVLLWYSEVCTARWRGVLCFCFVLQSSLGNFVELKLEMAWLFVKFLVGFAIFLVV